MTRLLLEAGSKVNNPNAHKHTPLHLAAQNGHLALSRMLVEGGADPNYPDNIGNFNHIIKDLVYNVIEFP